MLVTEIGFYITAIPAVLIYGIGKGGLGGALGGYCSAPYGVNDSACTGCGYYVTYIMCDGCACCEAALSPGGH